MGYWDTRDRETFFQITNNSSEDIKIHIQIFDASNNCFEFDYFDTLTPFDTHVYNISNLDRNNGIELAPPILSDGHGIIAVTHVNNDNTINTQRILSGNFRIIDSSGYEYRTNFAGSGLEEIPVSVLTNRINFNDVGGTVHSDIVVISYLSVFSPGGIQPTIRDYGVRLFDENENPISYPSIRLGCEQPGFQPAGNFNINVGINQRITNSRGGPSVCAGTDPVGFVELISSFEDNFVFPLQENSSFEPMEHTIVYAGLNSGSSSTGSMTVAPQSAETEFIDICVIFPEICEDFCLIFPELCNSEQLL